MFLTGAIGMLCVYIAWLVAVQRTVTALNAGTTNKSAAVAVLFFIYFYSPWYNIGNNALAYSKTNFCFNGWKLTIHQAYMVEIFPYAERSRGISIEQ
jgi:hypothetical protein